MGKSEKRGLRRAREQQSGKAYLGPIRTRAYVAYKHKSMTATMPATGHEFCAAASKRYVSNTVDAGKCDRLVLLWPHYNWSTVLLQNNMHTYIQVLNRL